MKLIVTVVFLLLIIFGSPELMASTSTKSDFSFKASVYLAVLIFFIGIFISIWDHEIRYAFIGIFIMGIIMLTNPFQLFESTHLETKQADLGLTHGSSDSHGTNEPEKLDANKEAIVSRLYNEETSGPSMYVDKEQLPAKERSSLFSIYPDGLPNAVGVVFALVVFLVYLFIGIRLLSISMVVLGIVTAISIAIFTKSVQPHFEFQLLISICIVSAAASIGIYAYERRQLTHVRESNYRPPASNASNFYQRMAELEQRLDNIDIRVEMPPEEPPIDAPSYTENDELIPAKERTANTRRKVNL